ncbi:MAG TPA: PD-(D/E)XK nuclease family protein [Mycobacteriales bacterium]|nr:PD-(D/E)XK nuclease family protein [Mycobacteriales bacterium]
MEQLGLDGMPQRLFACTPSKLLTWLDCPRRYRFQYVDRPSPERGPAWAHNSVGTSVHLALARLWDLPVEDRTPAAARGLVAQAWRSEGFADEAQAQRWKGYAADMVAAYVSTLDVSAEPRGVERTVAFTSPGLSVHGRVDRVDERDGSMVVVDYKTGRSALSTDDARGSLALALYVLGSRRTFRRPATRVELHHLPSGTVHAWEHTEESLERHVGRAEAIAAEASAAATVEDYPARPSSLCAWCDFARHCPEGREASGGPQKPWAGLAQERSPLEDEVA